MTFDELAKDLVTDYTINGKDTLKRVKWSLDCLEESFKSMRATDITTDKIQVHIEKRMKEGLSNASIRQNERRILRAQNEEVVEMIGAPGVTRTRGTRIRNPLLYPPELQGQP